MDAQKAASNLISAIKTPRGKLTVADAATASGLALRDAERGMHYLVSEYRGHLAATEKGELLFSFPTGFTKPWETIEGLEKVWARVKKGLLGFAKFVVRAWITIVMVAYVAIFALILLALSAAQKSDRDRDDSFGSSFMLHMLIRVVLDSLFWTFHPFSPFAVGREPYYASHRPKKVPFYERVNQFFFGPEKPATDPLANQRLVLTEIRAKKGRVGLADVLRVTGITREQADPLMSKLLLDYDGEVTVSEDGGIIYLFPEIRKTAQGEITREPMAIWQHKEKLLPLTGNPAGSNFLIAGLNGFNLLMSTVAISGGWTVEMLQYIFTAGAIQAKYGALPPAPTPGTPLLLGWIPFVFSAVLFALPIGRRLSRGREKNRVAHENGRRWLLRAVLANLDKRSIEEDVLRLAYKQGSGVEPNSKAFVREILKLGGEIQVSETGKITYRFPGLVAEAEALREARVRAGDFERDVGGEVFSSAR